MNLSWDDVNQGDNTDRIFELIIDHVRKNHCCRVGWACKEIMGQEVQENVLDKLAARVVATGEFIKETSNLNFKYDWNITKNPSYRFKDRHPYWFNTFIITISVFISTIVNILVKRNHLDELRIPATNSQKNIQLISPKDTTSADK